MDYQYCDAAILKIMLTIIDNGNLSHSVISVIVIKIMNEISKA